MTKLVMPTGGMLCLEEKMCGTADRERGQNKEHKTRLDYESKGRQMKIRMIRSIIPRERGTGELVGGFHLKRSGRDSKERSKWLPECPGFVLLTAVLTNQFGINQNHFFSSGRLSMST